MVSVVIPLLNAVGDIPPCIAALRKQTYPSDRFEIIVADNGSSDGSQAALEKCGVRWVERAERGRAKALNAGLGIARGDIVCTTDISCIAEPQWIEQVVSTFRNNPDVGCVAGEIKQLPGRDNSAVRYQARTGYMSPMRALKRDRLPFLPFADGANASFRRQVFDQIGPFEETFYKGADVEICYRMLILTRYKIAFNRLAIVWEAGEPNLAALVKQRYRIGLGTPLMELKYPQLYSARRDAPALKSRYWAMRAGLHRFARIAGGHLKGVVDRAAHERAMDESLALVLGLAQQYGRWRGRSYVHTGAIPTPVEPRKIAEFMARGPVQQRVIEVL